MLLVHDFIIGEIYIGPGWYSAQLVLFGLGFYLKSSTVVWTKLYFRLHQISALKSDGSGGGKKIGKKIITAPNF